MSDKGDSDKRSHSNDFGRLYPLVVQPLSKVAKQNGHSSLFSPRPPSLPSPHSPYISPFEMSDNEHQHDNIEPKAEDANSPINIKVSSSFPLSPMFEVFWYLTIGLSSPYPSPSNVIHIFCDMQVVTQQGEEVFFKIKRSTKLSKLQSAYASKVGKDVSSIRWVSSRFFPRCEIY